MGRIGGEHSRGGELLKQRRREYDRRVFMWWAELVGKRAEDTMKLTSFRFCRGDLHVHSTYSDGTGTVDDIKIYADKARLDSLFIADHNTVNQKRSCRKFNNVWWGQEVGSQRHHLAILGLERKYGPTDSLAHDYHHVEELGGVPFVAHPAGWFPATRYPPERMDVPDTLGEEFAMEVLNGANQVFDCFDETDEVAIHLWDKHLSQGKRVVGLACTDAHLPEALGSVWTGVLARRLAKGEIMKAVRRGHCYASDGPALVLWLGDKTMGDTALPVP